MPNGAARFREYEQHCPSPIGFSIPAISEAELPVIQSFRFLTEANLHPFLTEERDRDLFPADRPRRYLSIIRGGRGGPLFGLVAFRKPAARGQLPRLRPQFEGGMRQGFASDRSHIMGYRFFPPG